MKFFGQFQVPGGSDFWNILWFCLHRTAPEYLKLFFDINVVAAWGAAKICSTWPIGKTQ